MKIFKLCTFLLVLVFLKSCAQEKQESIKIVDQSTGFKIVLPPNFSRLSESEKSKKLNQGKDKIDVLFESDIDLSGVGEAQLFKVDETNYFIFSVQDFDPKVDGDYLDAINETNSTVIDAYKKAFPDKEMTYRTVSENVDGVKFMKFILTMKLSERRTMNVINYNKLFGTKDFIASIIFTNMENGRKMEEAFKNAKFKK